jgi:hypothetical protein
MNGLGAQAAALEQTLNRRYESTRMYWLSIQAWESNWTGVEPEMHAIGTCRHSVWHGPGAAALNAEYKAKCFLCKCHDTGEDFS